MRNRRILHIAKHPAANGVLHYGDVVELVDTAVFKTEASRHTGSSPVVPTNYLRRALCGPSFFIQAKSDAEVDSLFALKCTTMEFHCNYIVRPSQQWLGIRSNFR